jgi:endoglycosylceramidase
MSRALLLVAWSTLVACDSEAPSTAPSAVEDASVADAVTSTGGSGDASSADIDASTDIEATVAEGWIRVADGRLVDDQDREWQLRGINARVEGLFDVTFDDGRVALQPIPAFDASDASEMARLGFNWLRLPINWSGLEPTEGTIEASYLERLDEVVELATDAGLYVLIDFHQDAYSKHFGEDGAPLWAIVPAPTPDQLLEGPLLDLAARRLSAPVLAAFESFFRNEESLQERFLPVWRTVTARYADEPMVIGFEPYNEPVLVHFNPEEDLLHAFYRKLIPSMRETNPRHTLWLEPAAKRNFVFESPVPTEPLGDDQIVYAPHLYPNFAGVSYATEERWASFLERTFVALEAEARAWDDAAMAWGEWGMDPRGDEAAAYFPVVQEMSATRGIAQALWLWKEDSQDSWGMYDFDDASEQWVLRTSAVSLVEQPYVMAVPGRLVSHTFDRDARRLETVFVANGTEGPPLLFVPETVYPSGFVVSLDGSEVVLEPVEGHPRRSTIAWPQAAGTYTVVVSPR